MHRILLLAVSFIIQGNLCAIPVTPLDSAPAITVHRQPGYRFFHHSCDRLPTTTDKVLSLSSADTAWLSKTFRTPQPGSSATSSKKAVIQDFIALLHTKKSISILFKNTDNETQSFIIQITWNASAGRNTWTDIRIYDTHPTIRKYILEFVKTCVFQKLSRAQIATRVAVGSAIGLGAAYFLTNTKKTTVATTPPLTIKPKPEPRRHRAENPFPAPVPFGNAQDDLTKFNIEFKRFLTSTPFTYFIVGHKPDADGLPSFAAARGKTLTDTVERFCTGYFQSTFEGLNINLTGQQFAEFFGGSFKASTIDIISRFQAAYFVALSEEGTADTDIGKKAAAILDLKEQVVKLAEIDPVEAKRILCFHPRLIWNTLIENVNGNYTNAFYARLATSRTLLDQWQIIAGPNINEPYARISKKPYANFPGGERDYHPVKQDFCTILKHTLADPNKDWEAYCLTHFFPCDIAWAQGQHLVNAA